jgi:amidase
MSTIHAKSPHLGLILVVIHLAWCATPLSAQATRFNLIEATIPEMQAAMETGLIDSDYLVRQYLRRIDAFDVSGPMLNSVLSLNPEALATARALDAERAASGPRGPLHGIPILLKDNIDTFDMPTTAGALVLKDSIPPDDAFLTQQLRDAGAIILGKANLSEFARFLAHVMPDGFSAVGGQTLNPYDPVNFSPLGSSAGSAVAAAANLAAATVGSETFGSIIAPSSVNSVVGIRPTLGLISRDGVIPISFTQDTAGPITRTVEDAAILLGAMTGVDPSDPATAASEGQFHTDYTPFLDPNGLEGKRLGIVRSPLLQAPDFISEVKLAAAEQAFASLEPLGAVVIDDLDISDNLLPLLELWGPDVPAVLTYEFLPTLENYLASLGDDAPAKTLAEIVAFNEDHAAEAIPHGQSLLELALELGGDLTAPEYLQQLEAGQELGEGFAELMDANDLDALVFTDISSAFGAIPGFPSVSVPAGYLEDGLPVSIEFLGRPFSEPDLIEIAYAFQQGTLLRMPPGSAPAIAGDQIPEPASVGLVVMAIVSAAALLRVPARRPKTTFARS